MKSSCHPGLDPGSIKITLSKWIPASAGMTIVLFFSLFPIPYSLFPTYAAVNLKDVYAFGNLNSFAQGVDMLIVPGLSIAAVLLIFYLLIGALRYMLSRGDKNDLENARNMITHSIVGFIILFVVFLLIEGVIEVFHLPQIF